MPEQNLDDADVDPVFQQMGGKAVPQCAVDPLSDLSGLCRIDDDAMELPGADGFMRCPGNSQPSRCITPAMPDLPPPRSRADLPGAWHCDIGHPAARPGSACARCRRGHLERRDLRHAQASAIGDRESCPCLRQVVALSSRNLVLTQHHGQSTDAPPGSPCVPGQADRSYV